MSQTIITADSEKITEIIKNAIALAIPDIVKGLNQNSNNKSDYFISRAEYAQRNGISIQLVDKLRRQGKLEHKKVGRRMLIKVDNG